MHKIEKMGEPLHFKRWKSDFKHEHGREPTYEDLASSEEYRRLKKHLTEEQGYVCCYCEKPIGGNTFLYDCDIEHFMPRHPDKKTLTEEECRICENAQLDYQNMFASCRGENLYMLDHCNHRKENWFDFRYCISPSSDVIDTLFGFRLDGKMISVNNNTCAEAMKNHLNLNTYILCEQRKIAYETIIEAEFEEEELLLERV